jgi:hypothetical protein
MLATLYSFGKNISISTAAHLFIQADSILNGGANYYVIQKKFAEHGILPEIVGLEEKRFIADVKLRVSGQYAIIDLGTASTGNVTLFDMQGRRLSQTTFQSASMVFVPVSSYAAGVYLLQVQLPGQVAALKMVKE